MGDPRYDEKVRRRLNLIYRNMRDGCATCLCLPKGALCRDCLERFMKAANNPKDELEKLEKEYQG